MILIIIVINYKVFYKSKKPILTFLLGNNEVLGV